MGKRSDFERVPRDFYATIDPAAVVPLVPFIRGSTYAEPCCGKGDLVDQLIEVAKCKYESDFAKGNDALDLTKEDLQGIDYIITNPPYAWDLLSRLLDHFISLKPTWLLLPADFMHNKRSGPYMKQCKTVVSIGRLYWNENKIRGKDNYCWYLFDKLGECTPTIFIGRDQ